MKKKNMKNCQCAIELIKLPIFYVYILAFIKIHPYILILSLQNTKISMQYLKYYAYIVPGMFQCNYCKIVSPSEDLAISHIRCGICGYFFLSLSHSQVVMKSHQMTPLFVQRPFSVTQYF